MTRNAYLTTILCASLALPATPAWAQGRVTDEQVQELIRAAAGRIGAQSGVVTASPKGGGDQRPERFAVGEKVDARVTLFDRKARKIAVSIKALEVAEEKEAIAQYGSSDSGATLGDILGTALKRKGEEAEKE